MSVMMVNLSSPSTALLLRYKALDINITVYHKIITHDLYAHPVEPSCVGEGKRGSDRWTRERLFVAYLVDYYRSIGKGYNINCGVQESRHLISHRQPPSTRRSRAIVILFQAGFDGAAAIRKWFLLVFGIGWNVWNGSARLSPPQHV